MTEKEFFKKYPDADPSRFVFKDDKVFFKINPDNEYRLADIEYRVFYDSPEWTKYLTSYKDRGFGIWFADGTIQTYEKNPSKEDINNFLIHVTEEKYFAASLPQLSITNSSSLDYKQNPYLIAIIAAYVSTYVCGISTKHMEFNDQTPGIVTSMVRYHLYYQMNRFLTYPSKLERYVSRLPNSVKRHKPTNDVWTKAYHQGSEELLTWLSEQKDRHKIRNYRYSKNARGTVTGITYEKITGQSPKDVNDYKMFIATTTDGLTKIGQKLLQQSVESYVYAVLGAQASLRFPIVGEGAKSLQTQDKFRTIVKETIVQSDVTITISNMRAAIASTNVVLNMAISPGMILVPSNLIIQKEKIPGYNNVLTLATDKMKFGKNTGVNYKAPSTQETPDTPKTSLQTIQKTESPKPKPKPPKISVASEILGVTMMIGGFLISKYVF